MKNLFKIIVPCLPLCLIGCVQRIGDFTVGTTKNMDLKRTNYKVDSSVRISGRDTKHVIIVVPTGVPDLKEAMDNAIEKNTGAVALSDVTLKRGWFYVPYVYGQSWYEVEGCPVYPSNN